MVLGIIGVPLVWMYGIPSLAALILGIVSYLRLRTWDRRLVARDRAVAGIILGGTSILAGAATLALLATLAVTIHPSTAGPSAPEAVPFPTPIPTTAATGAGPITETPAQPASAAPQGATFPAAVDAGLRYASSRSAAPTFGPTALPGATPGATLTPAVFTSRNEISIALEYGGNGQPFVGNSIPPGPSVYGEFSSLLYSSQAAAVKDVSVPLVHLTNTSPVALGSGTATLGTDLPPGGVSAITWAQGQWTIAVEGPDPTTAVIIGQQLASFFTSHPLLPPGPGSYFVVMGSAGLASEATWVHNSTLLGVNARGTDPTTSAQLAAAMRRWPDGAPG
jgi:hypothetical protein